MKLKDFILLSAVAADNLLDSDDQQCDLFDPTANVSRGKKKKEKKTVQRIIGGQPVADSSTWPWMVSMSQRCYGYDGDDCDYFVDHEDGKGAGHICGASAVFSGEYLITAAHCVDDDAGNAGSFVFENFEILYGSNDLANSNSARIISSVVHPAFDASKLFNDIAVLKLDQSIMDSTKVACIPTTNYNLDDLFPDGEQDAFVAGWGMTETSGGTVTVSNEVFVPIVDDETCETKYQELLDYGDYDYSSLHNMINNQTICAGFPDGVNGDGELADACQGDSGGPLVRKVDGVGYSLIGLTSWGYGCAATFGVYTQVGPYAEWIQEAIAALDDCANNDLCLNQDKVDSGACGGGTGDCGDPIFCNIKGQDVELPFDCPSCKSLKKGRCGDIDGGDDGPTLCDGVELPADCANCKKFKKGKCGSGGGGGGPVMCGSTELPEGCPSCKKFKKGKCSGGGGGDGGTTMCGDTPLPDGCKNCKKFKKGKC